MATGGEELTLSEESSDIKCTTCSKKSRIKQAKSYCRNCTKYLCVDCVDTHNEYIEDHTLVGVHDIDQLDNVWTEKCGKHRDKAIELFCADHDEEVCSDCATLEHRSCQVKNIAESLEELKNPDVQEVTKQLQTALQQMDQSINAIEKYTEELSQSESKYLLEIEEYTQRLLVRIEELKGNARKNVKTKHQQLVAQAEKFKQACTISKTYINKCLDDTKLSYKRKANLFILEKKGQKLTRNVEALSEDTEQMIKRARFVYQTNTRIEQYLTDTRYMGRIEDKYQASLKATISASVKGDSLSCNIQACCLLPDGTVILTDYENDRVKHVDTSDYTVKDQCRLMGHLLAISCIGPREVVVGTGTTNVHVVSLGNTIATTSTIQLNHACSRIVHSNGELFTTDNNRVYVHDMTGTLLRTICENESAEDMFSDIQGIALNQTGDRVYVADRRKGLICTDREGQEVFMRSMEELGLSGAHGVCSDERGNVLVCGFSSNSVVQVTEDGRVIGKILSKVDGIEKPQCLCYDADRRVLYVGSETSNMLVYQLV